MRCTHLNRNGRRLEGVFVNPLRLLQEFVVLQLFLFFLLSDQLFRLPQQESLGRVHSPDFGIIIVMVFWLSETLIGFTINWIYKMDLQIGFTINFTYCSRLNFPTRFRNRCDSVLGGFERPWETLISFTYCRRLNFPT